MRPMNFGYGVTGHLYFPNNTPAGTRLPAVIWLHGYSYPLGYMWVYRSDPHPILALVNAGYAVLAIVVFLMAGLRQRGLETRLRENRYASLTCGWVTALTLAGGVLSLGTLAAVIGQA